MSGGIAQDIYNAILVLISEKGETYAFQHGFHYNDEILHKMIQLRTQPKGSTPKNTINSALNMQRNLFSKIHGKSGHYSLYVDFQIPNHISSKKNLYQTKENIQQIIKDFQIDVGKVGIKNDLLRNLSLESENLLKKSLRNPPSSIVLVGKISSGKSFLFNFLLKILMIENYPNQLNKMKRGSMEEEHPIMDELLADYQLDQNQIGEYFKNNEKESNILYQEIEDLKLLEKEDDINNLILNYHLSPNLKINDKDKLDRYPFMLPSSNTTERTTTVVTCIRFGLFPAIFIHYRKSLKDIPLQHGDTLKKVLEQEKLTEKDLNFLIESKFFAMIGKGNNLTKDRIAIRSIFFKKLREKGAKFCIEKVIIYLPVPILKTGSELVDVPGFDDDDTICIDNLEKTMKEAKVIWCVTEKAFSSSKLLVETVFKSGILERIMADPITYGLAVVHIPERSRNHGSQSIIQSDEEDISSTKKKLEQMIGKISSESKLFNDKKAEKLKGYVLKKIESFVFYPLLFTSLMLNLKSNREKFIKLHEKSIIASNGLKGLAVIQKVLYGIIYNSIDYFIECKLIPIFELLFSNDLKTKPNLTFHSFENLKNIFFGIDLNLNTFDQPKSNNQDDLIEMWKKENRESFDKSWNEFEIEFFFDIFSKELKSSWSKNPLSDKAIVAKDIKDKLFKTITTQPTNENNNNSRKSSLTEQTRNTPSFQLKSIMTSFKEKIIQQKLDIEQLTRYSETSNDVGMTMIKNDNLILPKTLLLEKKSHCKQNCPHQGENFGHMIECEKVKF